MAGIAWLGPWRPWVIGGLLFTAAAWLVTVLLASGSRSRELLPCDEAIATPTAGKIGCELQLATRANKCTNLREEKATAEARAGVFKAAMRDGEHPHFVVARTEYDRENKLAREAAEKIEGLEVKSRQSELPWQFGLSTLLIAVSIILTIFLRRGASKAGFPELPGPGPLNGAFWVLFLFAFGMHSLQTYLTSIYQVDKIRFSWDSYCVSPAGYWGTALVALGCDLLIAIPASLAWSTQNRDYLPRLNASHPDGKWGTRDYLHYLENTFTVGVALLMLPTLLWLGVLVTGKALQEKYYLLSTAGGVAVVGTALVRIILRARDVRARYREERAKAPDATVPGDPTAAFLADRWWKLPAAFTGILTLAGIALDLLGVSTKFLDLVK